MPAILVLSLIVCSLIQETARRQSTEHEVAIGKEISARAHHQKEVKALSKQRTQDLADMVQLEQEVRPPSCNICVSRVEKSNLRPTQTTMSYAVISEANLAVEFTPFG